jgi:hypothetical protein
MRSRFERAGPGTAENPVEVTCAVARARASSHTVARNTAGGRERANDL